MQVTVRGHAVQELDVSHHQPAELVEAGRLHSRDDVVGAGEVLSQPHPASLVSA
jgi:hypothetical protein